MVAKENDNKINFTKANIEKFLIPIVDANGKAKNLVFHDSKQKGLCIIISYGGSKTFYLSVKISGRPERIKLGKFPDITVEQARKLAIHNRSLINQGKNPNEEKKKLKQDITLKELFDIFLEKHCNQNNKAKTIKEYKRTAEIYFDNLKNKKISQITKTDIEKLHQKIHDNNGKYIANRTISLLKVMFNKAIEWGCGIENPAQYIKKYKEIKRDRFLQPNEIKAFFESLDQEPNIILKNYFYILLFTGARKTNILEMQWQDISFERQEWLIPETKNGEKQTIPLTNEAQILLNELKTNSNYVFYSKTSKSGHLEEPKMAWQRLLKRANIKDLRIHDIRRTLGSYQAITGSSLLIIGKTLGHKTSQATEIYARLNNDPVREATQKAIDKIMEYRDK